LCDAEANHGKNPTFHKPKRGAPTPELAVGCGDMLSLGAVSTQQPKEVRPPAGRVRDEFATGTAAATIPNKRPLTTFFNPDLLVTQDGGRNLTMMGRIFHEGLHGFTGINDPGLQTRFGCMTVDPYQTQNLTVYLGQFVRTPPFSDNEIDTCH
jgi:hypothetical protein